MEFSSQTDGHLPDMSVHKKQRKIQLFNYENILQCHRAPPVVLQYLWFFLSRKRDNNFYFRNENEVKRTFFEVPQIHLFCIMWIKTKLAVGAVTFLPACVCCIASVP